MSKTSDKSSAQKITSKLSPLFLLAVNSTLLVSCATQLGNKKVLLKDELEHKLERYTKLEPEIQRVLALESDMQVIVSELSKYSALGTDPLGSTTTENNMPIDNNAAQKVKVKTVESNNSYSAVYNSNCSAKSSVEYGHCTMKIGIHIAAFSDEKYVLPGWLYLKEQLPTVLTKDKSPLSMQIVQQNIAYQSLRVGPFNSVYQAKTVCDEARHLVSCSVVEYHGNKVGG